MKTVYIGFKSVEVERQSITLRSVNSNKVSKVIIPLHNACGYRVAMGPFLCSFCPKSLAVLPRVVHCFDVHLVFVPGYSQGDSSRKQEFLQHLLSR
jgi:hypothetical protein